MNWELAGLGLALLLWMAWLGKVWTLESIQNKGGGSDEGLSVLGSGYTSHKHPPGRS